MYNIIYRDISREIVVEHRGFVSGRSVTSNFCVFIEFLLRSLNSGYQVDVIYNDFSKAFDKLDHVLLIQKLDNSNIATLVKWLESYPECRPESVRVNDVLSDVFISTFGLPRGSHLGPPLFSIFINDIRPVFKSSFVLLYLKIFCDISDQNHPEFVRFSVRYFSIINRICRKANALFRKIDFFVQSKFSFLTDLRKYVYGSDASATST